MAQLVAPFPWFGGKRKVASLVWERLGEVKHYIEPFFGGGTVSTASRSRSTRPRERAAAALAGWVPERESQAVRHPFSPCAALAAPFSAG
jgi:hypothetical protein